MEGKKPWQSKTILAAFITAALGLFGAADKFSPAQITSALSVLAVLLRYVTKDKIILTESK